MKKNVQWFFIHQKLIYVYDHVRALDNTIEQNIQCTRKFSF